MSSVSPRHHCWSILTSNSAEETAQLIESLEREDPATFRKISSIGIYRERWRSGALTEHDFLHRVKATVDNEVGSAVRQEANQLVSTVLRSHRNK